MKSDHLANRGLSEDQKPTLGLNWLWDESGQDVIEYALLGAIVGIASLLTWQLVATEVGIAYTQGNSDVQDLSCMPGPDGTGCP
jgi:Flp pilus assembly pilin Flp